MLHVRVGFSLFLFNRLSGPPASGHGSDCCLQLASNQSPRDLIWLVMLEISSHCTQGTHTCMPLVLRYTSRSNLTFLNFNLAHDCVNKIVPMIVYVVAWTCFVDLI